MRTSILKEFAGQKPRAIVLDDNDNTREMTARKLRSIGFEVAVYSNVKEFRKSWRPGTVDVIIADWDLSDKSSENGDRVLQEVRTKDWDVPFVLISGQLADGDQKVTVLEHLLEGSGANFVKRGQDGIARACEEAQDLIERRDQTLLKLILPLREAALRDERVKTTSGTVSFYKLLADLVARPSTSKDFSRPVASRSAKVRAKKMRKK